MVYKYDYDKNELELISNMKYEKQSNANQSNDGYIHLVDPVIQVNSFIDMSIPITVTEVIPYES